MSLNKVFLQGRLVRDPEVRTSPDGVNVCRFSLAVDRDFKGKDGQRGCDFINLVAFRQKADFISQYFTKGSQAVVDGKLQVQSYESGEGEKRTSVNVLVENIYFSGAKKEGSESGTNNAPPPKAQSKPKNTEQEDYEDYNDTNLPF